MPNWVHTEIAFYGNDEQIKDLKNFIAGEDTVYNVFDFNKIDPMPKELDIPEDGVSDLAIKCFVAESDADIDMIMAEYKLSRERFKELRKQGERYVCNKILYGFRSWYGWCVKHWGTKWNACDAEWKHETKHETLCFNTAFAFPEPVILKLSERYPEVVFYTQIEYEGENTPVNVVIQGGHYTAC